ncbi:MAG: methionine--tRNA ligase [Candidatus Saccharimonadales bacterium]|nr:methionine--tRNA ligase [Candidatus Saccharimonadales bacterium]
MTEKTTYYVTTSIPYVNDVPHIGHAMEFIQADALARYHRQLLGQDVLYSTGTDEHGGKVLETAKEKGIAPEKYTEQISTAFKDMLVVLDVANDKFVRTTDAAHIKVAQQVWKDLSKYIYKGKYVGMYDQKEESYLTDEEAREIKQKDPDRYKRLQKLEEENYFFKLSEFSRKVRDLVDKDQIRVVPKTQKNAVMQLLKEGLEDISISRPKSKLAWGVPVPGDPNHTMYVWFEALINYISVLGYPDGEDFEKYWPADVHVLGKDINRFHSAIWPSMLIGLELPLPKNIYVHGFITLEGKVMSKSLGNVIAPLEIVDKYGADALRYYLLRHIPSYGDGDFGWEKFEAAYNGELGNELGNLVQRIAKMIDKYQNGLVGDMPDDEHDEGFYHDAMADFRFDKALDYTWSMIRGLNQYIEEQKPWVIAKEGDVEHLKEVLAYCAGSTLQIAKLIAPSMPKSSEMIMSIFADGVVSKYEGVLFPRIHNYTEANS